MVKLPQDIANMDKRIGKMRNRKKSAQKASQTRLFLENSLRIASEFVAPIVIGLCIGFVLDKFFGTRPIIMLVMTMFGGAAGMLNVYKAAQQIDKELNKE